MEKSEKRQTKLHQKIYQLTKTTPSFFPLSNTERDVKTTITLEVKKLILYYFIDVGGREIVQNR